MSKMEFIIVHKKIILKFGYVIFFDGMKGCGTTNFILSHL